MSADIQKNNTGVLSFTNLLPGFLALSWRLPSIILSLRNALKMKADAKMSIGIVLERNAEKYPTKNAVLYENTRLTHLQFNQKINQYANYFIEKGVKKGDVVIVFIENRPELLMIIGALAKIGAIASLINTNQRKKVLLHSINQDPGKTFIIGEELLDAFNEIKAELDLNDSYSVFFQVDRGEKTSPKGMLDLSVLIKQSPDTNPPTTGSVTLKDRFVNIFTSGTTGLPKASIQMHRRWIMCFYWLGKANLNLKANDVMYISIPFFHANALAIAWPSAASGGAAMAIRRHFSASNFWSDIEKYKATSFVYIGELCRYLFNRPADPTDSQNRVTKIVGNGLQPEIWKAFKKRFGISKVFEFYGAADGTTGFTNILNIDETVGLCPSPFAVVEFDVEADQPLQGENGFLRKVKKGESGLLITKLTDSTPFTGYTNKAANEKKILRDVFENGDAWFSTGDLMQDIGFRHLRFVDRLGDTFRWKGENVSTREVEKNINVFPQVKGSAVYGVLVPGANGRAGMAAISSYVKPEEFDFQGLATLLRENVPSYAVPLFIRLVPEFNTTATHKILKNELRDEGMDPDKVQSSLYVLLPKAPAYVPLTKPLYKEVIAGKYQL
ncbi:long-chain-acyl-CoA synthetase [bacterium]|nr:long-chain-acyl-CoA synthetase [bacterium]